MNSLFLKLSKSDWLKGLYSAVVTPIAYGLIDYANTNTLPDLPKLKALGIIGLCAGMVYILKNLVTNSNGKVLTPEQ